jgi:acetyl-CoA carboxylase biotin carboxyl carrier protein
MADDEAERIRALGEILREFDLDALRVKVGDTEYELVRRDPAATAPLVVAAPTAPPAAPSAAGAPAAGGPAPSASAPANVKRVTAPVVGVFYAAPSPGAAPFVAVGDRVSVGQVVCILEAMKLMNEITSEVAGVVTRVLPQNGELVSLGDDLVWIEP